MAVIATHGSRIALVTGGTSGIGLATARRLLEDGYRVAVCSRTPDRVDEATASLGGRAIGFVADMAVEADAAGVVDQTVEQLGGLDVLVNAHGIQGTLAPIAELRREDWQLALLTNLLGPVTTTTAAIAHLRARGGGSVVNVASIDGLRAEPLVAVYGVAKAALVAFTQYAAAELSAHGIRVNAVAPGWVRTPMTEPLIREAGVDVGTWHNNALGRAGTAEELAGAIAFLAGPDAGYVTGETLVVDGGQSILMRELGLRPVT